MAAAEMPWAAASFLKSASQRSKLPVLRQLGFWATAGVAFWAKAGTGAPAKRPEMRPATAAQARTVRPGTMCRIGLSAVVDDIVTAQGPAGKPSLLILRQLAYPDL